MKTFKYFRYLFLISLMATQTVLAGTYSGKLDSIWSAARNKRADKAFSQMAYIKSIHLYEKNQEKGVLPDSLLSQLAQAYYKTHQAEKAEETLRLIKDYSTFDLGLMAQVLEENRKYDEAEGWYNKYHLAVKDQYKTNFGVDMSKKVEEILSTIRYRIEPTPYNSVESDFGPFYINNELIFSSARKESYFIKRLYAWNERPYLKLFSATNDPEDGVKINILRRQLRSDYHNGPAFFTADQNEAYITRNINHSVLKQKTVDGYNHLEILHATKNDKGKWQKPVTLSFNGKTFSCGHAFLTADGNKLYFASDRPGGFGGTDIYYVEKKSGSWSEPVNMGEEINSSGDEMFPFFDSEGKIYFSSTGHLGLGGHDLFVAKKKRNGKYDVKNMGFPINSASDDISLFLNENNIDGYFASNREGGEGSDDIYAFSILKPVTFIEVVIKIKGIVINEFTEERLPGIEVALKDNDNQTLASDITRNKGNFEFELSDTSNLSFDVVADGYLPYRKPISYFTNLDSVVIVLTPLEMVGLTREIKVLYDYDKWDIRKDATEDLDYLLSFLNAHPSVHIMLAAHTDSRGSAKYNMNLSKKRVVSAKKYLTERGIDETRIETSFYGETKLKNKCADGVDCTEEMHQENRRTEVTIIEQ